VPPRGGGAFCAGSPALKKPPKLLRWLITVFKKMENSRFRCVFLDNYYLLINKNYLTYCCGASEPEASERSSSLICAERGF
jgi:hypothetical protein